VRCVPADNRRALRTWASSARTQALLDRISKKQDGNLAAANTANRKRAVLNNAMKYAMEVEILFTNRSASPGNRTRPSGASSKRPGQPPRTRAIQRA